MKKYSKVGKKPGKPAYRTPSWFKAKSQMRYAGHGKMRMNQRSRRGQDF